MKTRIIEYNLPISHQPLLEGLATTLNMSFDDLITFLLEAGGEVYLESGLPTDKMSDECIIILKQMKRRKDVLLEAIESKFQPKQ